MPIDGPWFITRAALEDYARLTGRRAAPPRDELEQEIARAHFVKLLRSGAELWRGEKPLRLRFVVSTGRGVGGGAPQLVRIEGDHTERTTPRARRVRLWDGVGSVTIDVVDEVQEQGPERRVAYRLADGTWYAGYRGHARPDHVERGAHQVNRPDWVSEQRNRRRRRGEQGRH